MSITNIRVRLQLVSTVENQYSWQKMIATHAEAEEFKLQSVALSSCLGF